MLDWFRELPHSTITLSRKDLECGDLSPLLLMQQMKQLASRRGSNVIVVN